eukprot:10326493-Alexandrium_andersonii.AAC.1
MLAAAWLRATTDVVFKAESPFEVQPLEPDALLATVRQAPPTAPGLGRWAPAEWAFLSREACRWLARLMDLAEAGCGWP